MVQTGFKPKLYLSRGCKDALWPYDLQVCHLPQIQDLYKFLVNKERKEFDENPQKFVDQEAAEVEALTKHLIKVYEEYKEEEEIYKHEIEEVQESTQKHLEEYKNLLVESIHDSDRNLMQRLSKGKDLTKLLEETFKHEELLSKGYVKKAICTLNIEQIKYLLFTEVDQSDLPDEQKEVDPFELDKRIKALKQFQNEGLEDRAKLEIEKKKFVRILEDVTCKRREADYMLRKEEEFLKNKPIIEKELDQREEVYLKLKKFWKNWETAFQKSLKDNYQQRFPAIFHNQKKMDVKGLSFGEMLNSLKQHCPKIVKKKKVSTPYSLNSISSNS
ncbi:uncharacterized protein PF3D7_1120000 [Halyomorpha halys]|uniref:uncharacterized protein PF3D7_1120000 n=1 Tax=Halyomorpha halys TaxID=286706 RepID=UPI0006D52855